jgi:preprotein translocase subunit SecB
MKFSPIQLHESHFEKILIECADQQSNSAQLTLPPDFAVEIFKYIKLSPSYWGIEPPVPGLNERTYAITLGLRTMEEGKFEGYKFELIASGVFSCSIENFKSKSVQDMVFEYGLTLLYGMMREQFANATSRMSKGLKLLPTMSFMGEMASLSKSTETPLEKRKKRVLKKQISSES